MRNRAPALPPHPRDPLLHIERCIDPADGDTLAADVRRGLTAKLKTLPSKYFYDEAGSQLFDQICDLPEYYLTRTDTALLRSRADELVAWASPRDIVELGSGSARKTRLVFDACARAERVVRYIPIDVSEDHLQAVAEELRREYPGMPVHGIAGDYEHHLERLPEGGRRLVLFLGSTIGNFAPAEASTFLQRLVQRLAAGDTILIGMDLRKPIEVLHAAYNDAAGLTAAFNRNVLHVVNRELNADFAPEEFEHLAFFNTAASQIEMHLRAARDHVVHIGALDLAVNFTAGETIHTEISRKFSRADAESLFAEAGCRLEHWWTDEREYFAEAVGVVGR